MSDSADNVVKLGGGGMLYADAREIAAEQQRVHAPDPPPWADQPEPPAPPTPQAPAAPSVVTPKNLPTKPPEPGFDWRELCSTVLELTGITAITVGGWLIAPFVGLIIAGIALVLFGAATSKAMRG